MKRQYERTSRRLDSGQVDTALRTAIAAHAQAHQLGDVLADAVAGCETRSVRLSRPGLLARLTGSGDPDTEHRSVALYTPGYLIIAITGANRGTHVRSARLDGVSVGTSALAAQLGHVDGGDNGVSVTGLWSGETRDAATSFFLGLGADADGTAFLTDLRAAITAAKTR
ncbi:hypothetical protein ACRYCC_30355 [Actinomadura scrupuli]|uniref:hypothetical protein n=1 Tax=Actinomadura scrupuli TaxID=559629 RepID=UPI003D9770B8